MSRQRASATKATFTVDTAPLPGGPDDCCLICSTRLKGTYVRVAWSETMHGYYCFGCVALLGAAAKVVEAKK